jgi:hydroxypyruvate isomerase
VNCWANIAFLFANCTVVEGMEAAAALGFATVELRDPYAIPLDLLAHNLDRLNLRVGLANIATGNPHRGDHGLAGDPLRADEFDAELARASQFVERIRPAKVNVLAGCRRAELDERAQIERLGEALALASARMRLFDVGVVTELLNDEDVPGFLLSTAGRALQILTPLVGRVGLQLDVYHLQRAERDFVSSIRRLAPLIGHIQISGFPSRTEPGSGELDTEAVLRAVLGAGYGGSIGLEYGPSGLDANLFGWMAAFDCVRG